MVDSRSLFYIANNVEKIEETIQYTTSPEVNRWEVELHEKIPQLSAFMFGNPGRDDARNIYDEGDD